MMNQGNMNVSEYTTLRASIIRCLVKDIRDGQYGKVSENSQQLYHRYICQIIEENIDLLNEENMRMVTTHQDEVIKPKKLSVDDILNAFFKK